MRLKLVIFFSVLVIGVALISFTKKKLKTKQGTMPTTSKEITNNSAVLGKIMEPDDTASIGLIEFKPYKGECKTDHKKIPRGYFEKSSPAFGSTLSPFKVEDFEGSETIKLISGHTISIKVGYCEVFQEFIFTSNSKISREDLVDELRADLFKDRIYKGFIKPILIPHILEKKNAVIEKKEVLMGTTHTISQSGGVFKYRRFQK